MLLVSARPLSDGGREIEAPAPAVWRAAAAEGLTRAEYGRSWWVFESRAEYENALD